MLKKNHFSKWQNANSHFTNRNYDHALKNFIEAIETMPELAYAITLDMDRMFTSLDAKEKITIVKNALSKTDNSQISNLYEKNSYGLKCTEKSLKSEFPIYDSFFLEKSDGIGIAVRNAFNNLSKSDIYTLNILFANQVINNDQLWIYFVNKYFYQFNLHHINLEESKKFRFQRLFYDKILKTVENGPVVSILVPAFNAEQTLEFAINSLQHQTWKPLEIIIVDDASNDSTWQICKNMSAKDNRIKILRNNANLGPYVSKNLALNLATGKYITCHDADDWAFPQRIENQINKILSSDKRVKATYGCMLRVKENGEFTRFINLAELTVDGIMRTAFVSLFFDSAYFKKHLGYWDSVKFGADSEILARFTKINSKAVLRDNFPLMICLDNPKGLTSCNVHGINQSNELSKTRKEYIHQWTSWHKKTKNLKINFPYESRPFDVPLALKVDTSYLKPSSMPEHALQKKSSTPPTQTSKNNTIYLAQEMISSGKHAEGLEYAKKNASSIEFPAINILLANINIENDKLWLNYVNNYLNQYDISQLELIDNNDPIFFRLHSTPKIFYENGPLVSVIMPAYNAERTIEYAVRSILNQTWKPLELIIVDDASTDSTLKIIQNISKLDKRIIVLSNAANVGPYVSKNFALRITKGEYITCHDADDWAHPQRLEKQIHNHIATESKASMIGMLRINENGYFSRISKISRNSRDSVLTGSFITTFFNSCFLKQVLGSWDEVRFAADSEIIRRAEISIKSQIERYKCFGLFQLDSINSLTNHPTYGYSPTKGLSPARKAYFDSYTNWHKKLNKHTTYLAFPQNIRKFHAPKEASVSIDALEKCITKYFTAYSYGNKKILKKYFCDICIVTNLRFPGGNASSTLNEVRFFTSNGLKVLLVHCPGHKTICKEYSERYNEYSSIIVSFDSFYHIYTDTLILRSPVISETDQFLSIINNISANKSLFVINNSMTKPNGEIVYSFNNIVNVMKSLNSPVNHIFPLGPAIRAELHENGYANSMFLNKYDWPPTFETKNFPFKPKKMFNLPYIIGKHGRDGSEKWLEDKNLLLKVYPTDQNFNIKILGGASKAQRLLGTIPSNWTVYEFGTIDPALFLSELDAFVYFPHSKLNEAFGRTVMEAMFSGIPCILPKRFKETFEGLAFFCEPEQVQSVVERLSKESSSRINFLKLVRDYSVENYSSESLLKRLERINGEFIKNEQISIKSYISKDIAQYTKWVETGC